MTEHRYKIGPDDIDTYFKALRYLTWSILKVWLILLMFAGLTKILIVFINMTHHLALSENGIVFTVAYVCFAFLAIGIAIWFMAFNAPTYAFSHVCFCDDKILIKKIVGSSVKVAESLNYSEIVEICCVKGSFRDTRKGASVVLLLYKRDPGASLLSTLPIGPKTDLQISEITKLVQAKNPKVVRTRGAGRNIET